MAPSKAEARDIATLLEVEATSVFAGATAHLHGPVNANVTFVVHMGSGGHLRIEAKTDDDGEATVSFVPNSPGNLVVEVVQQLPEIVVADPVTVQIAP